MSDERLREALIQAREKLKEQDELIEKLTSEPLGIARVVSISEPRSKKEPKRVKIVNGGDYAEVFYPNFEIRPGDEVVTSMTGQIVGKTEFDNTGYVVSVKRIINKQTCEIDSGGQSRIIVNPGIDLKPGDEILVDHSYSIAITKIAESENSEFDFNADTGVTWDHIGGLEEAKRALQEAVELPFLHPELFKWYGKKPIKGVELLGPPGCGKTMLAKALASSMAAQRGAQVGFLYIKGPEILDPFVGVAEAKLRSAFAKGRQHKQKTGVPGVMFIDEADSIFSKRGTGVSSDMEKTIVPTFLAEMDGLQDAGTIVILATNRADTLDPAVVRPGRIDRKIHVRRPNLSEAARIFELHLKGTPLNNGWKPKALAKHCSDQLFSQDRALYELYHKDGNRSRFTLGDLASGAMIANVVDHAISECLHEDLRSKRTKRGQGITSASLELALDRSLEQMREDNHDDDLKDFVARCGGSVIDIKKVKVA